MKRMLWRVHMSASAFISVATTEHEERGAAP